MSVFPESVYAQSQTIKPKVIDIALPGSEKGNIKAELELRQNQLKDGKVIKKHMGKIIEVTKEYIPVRIEIEKAKKIDREIWTIFQKYIECTNSSPDEDCEELKAQLDTLNDSTHGEGQISHATYITNRPELEKIRSCLNVAREVYPDFEARINIRMNVDQAGFPTSSHVVEESSMMSPYFANFPQCVAQFSKELKYKNPHEDNAEVTQTFIF